jgi:proton-dependent oligopeptide transporter, POT family
MSTNSNTQYLTAPVPSTTMPKGIPYIVGNEAAERFSYYGMRAILIVFMTKFLMGDAGTPDPMSREQAMVWYHNFSTAVYALPFIGAFVSDRFFGKYNTILWLSVVYCFGHLALALDETRTGLLLGLSLIALGSGGIKPCVSAHVGDQFGESNKHLLNRVFSVFYFAINFGAFFSSLLTPWLLEKYGPSVAFGVPGVLMVFATFMFWMGRNAFVHIPAGGAAFIKEAFSGEGLAAIAKLSSIYVFVAMFWSLFDQTGSAWVLQAEKMDRRFMGVEWSESQIQAVNPILILVFIPLFTGVIYPAVSKVVTITPLRKIATGFFIASTSFAVSALIENRMTAGETPGVEWQILAYTLITAAEILISITVLEFSYTQAPTKMKSFVMAFNLLSVSLGNQFTALVNRFIQNADKTSKLPGADYYWFFAGMMLLVAFVFIPVALAFKEKTYIQQEAPAH